MNKEDYAERLHEVREKQRQLVSQTGAEDWFDVIRNGDREIEARPVDRQDDIDEQEKITSDKWLIREENGDTYTVSEDTFDSEFDAAGPYKRQQFRIDLSWDDIESETGPTITGAECYVYVDALVHVPTDSVVSMDVSHFEYESNRHDTEYSSDSIPIETFYDSDKVSEVVDDG